MRGKRIRGMRVEGDGWLVLDSESYTVHCTLFYNFLWCGDGGGKGLGIGGGRKEKGLRGSVARAEDSIRIAGEDRV